jgi:GTP diphosphokinase / guanosine-3',5'-bis(diphosphate) 3'-diphosphatase
MDISHFLDFLYAGKKRKNGEPAVSHFFAVRDILKAEGVREEYILNAALLHDVMEDHNLSLEYLVLKFGEKVAKLVEILSKNPGWNTSYVKMKSSMDEVESSWADYPEAVMIKMADRLHNLRTAEGLPAERRLDYVEETYEILIPLFETILKTNKLGYYRQVMKSLLAKIIAKAASLKKKFQ